MKLLVINPNTTTAMTAQVVKGVSRMATSLAGQGVEVRGLTATFGSEVIATRQSFVIGAHAALELLRSENGWADTVIIACFGDPGLAALQELSSVPVVGMAQASLREAQALQRPFRIITAGAAWAAMLREAVAIENAQALCEGITVMDTTGLAIANDPDAFVAQVQTLLNAAALQGAPTVILGGAGFAGMRVRLRYAGQMIDGVEAATRAAVAHQRSLSSFALSSDP